MADFILEFTRSDSVLSEGNLNKAEWSMTVWKLFVDGSMNREGPRIGIVLESPTHENILKPFKLEFHASNNEAKYKALLTRLKMVKDMDVKSIQVFCDLKLVFSQINSEFEAREPRIVTYL